MPGVVAAREEVGIAGELVVVVVVELLAVVKPVQSPQKSAFLAVKLDSRPVDFQLERELELLRLSVSKSLAWLVWTLSFRPLERRLLVRRPWLPCWGMSRVRRDRNSRMRRRRRAFLRLRPYRQEYRLRVEGRMRRVVLLRLRRRLLVVVSMFVM